MVNTVTRSQMWRPLTELRCIITGARPKGLWVESGAIVGAYQAPHVAVELVYLPEAGDTRHFCIHRPSEV